MERDVNSGCRDGERIRGNSMVPNAAVFGSSRYCMCDFRWSDVVRYSHGVKSEMNASAETISARKTRVEGLQTEAMSGENNQSNQQPEMVQQ